MAKNLNKLSKGELKALPIIEVSAYNLSGLKTILNADYSLNKKDRKGQTLMHLFAFKGFKNHVKLLLEKGASQLKDNNGVTPLDIVVNLLQNKGHSQSKRSNLLEIKRLLIGDKNKAATKTTIRKSSKTSRRRSRKISRRSRQTSRRSRNTSRGSRKSDDDFVNRKIFKKDLNKIGKVDFISIETGYTTRLLNFTKEGKSEYKFKDVPGFKVVAVIDLLWGNNKPDKGISPFDGTTNYLKFFDLFGEVLSKVRGSVVFRAKNGKPFDPKNYEKLAKTMEKEDYCEFFTPNDPAWFELHKSNGKKMLTVVYDTESG